MRGMSRVECLPGESMYGNTTTSVAPASTHAANPCAIVGSASSMCATRTIAASPAIDCTRCPTQSIIRLAASLTEPWSTSKMAFIGWLHAGADATRSRKLTRGSVEHVEGQLNLSERRRYLHALHGVTHVGEHFTRERNAFGQRVLLRLLARAAHALNHRLRHHHARDFVRQEFRVSRRDERPDPRDHRDAHVLDRCEEAVQLVHIEHRLRDRKLGAGINLPLEAPQLVRWIDCRWVDADADGEPRRCADRVAAGIEPAIEPAHQI